MMLVGVTGIEPVTPSVSGKCSPAELNALQIRTSRPELPRLHAVTPPVTTLLDGRRRRGGGGNRTRVQGFAGPCLSHSATPPVGPGLATEGPVDAVGASERTTGFEPATLTLAR